MACQIQIRRSTAAVATTNNVTLAQGEFGYEIDTLKFKIGDGTTDWNSLPYLFDPGAFLQNNTSATSNPTVNDDSGDGYSEGSIWINTTSDEYFVCLDSTLGNAIWVNLTDKYTQQEVDDLIDNHTHVAANITDFDTEVSNNLDVSANTTHRNATGNPHGLVIQDIVPVQASPPLSPVAGDKFIRTPDYREFIYTGFKWLCTSTESDGGARNSSNVSNSYLRTWNGVPTNNAEFLAPEDITIVGLTITSNNSVNWSGIVTIGVTLQASVSTGGGNSGNDQTLDVDIPAGTRLRFFVLGNNIQYPKLMMYYRRRAS